MKGCLRIAHLSTYQDRLESIQYQLTPFFGSKQLIDITPVDVQVFRAQRKLRNGGLPTLATINADHAILKHVLSVAERHGLIQSNPAKRVPLPDPQNERDRILTEEEWKRLYNAAPKHLQPILLVAYELGPRAGEILNLTWDRVDLHKGFIRLRGQDTKTAEGRIVPLTPEVRSMLTKLSKVRRLDTNHVFLYRGKPIKRVKHAFATAVQDSALQDVRFHDLRHCAATNLRRAGVDTVTAMKIVGHKSEKMHKRYNSVSEADLTAAATKLNAYLSNTLITPVASSDSALPVSA